MQKRRLPQHVKNCSRNRNESMRNSSSITTTTNRKCCATRRWRFAQHRKIQPEFHVVGVCGRCLDGRRFLRRFNCSVFFLFFFFLSFVLSFFFHCGRSSCTMWPQT